VSLSKIATFILELEKIGGERRREEKEREEKRERSIH
jgi:hypothetical protein